MSLGRFVPLERFVLGRFVCAPPGATRHSWKKKIPPAVYCFLWLTASVHSFSILLHQSAQIH